MPDLNVSFAQNGEDIVLWRALGHIEGGVYLDVGANDPTDDSVSRKFYDAGWSGIAVEPNPVYAAAFREERPRDAVFEAVASDSADETMSLHLIEGTGLSTLIDGISAEHEQSGFAVRDIVVPVISLNEAIEQAGLAGRDLHFLSIDTEGAEAQVLASLDFTRFRPWVLVIEATAPMSTKRVHEGWSGIVEQAGYEFCFFDGLSRFYVAGERAAELKADLEYPAGILDAYTPIRQLDLQETLAATRAELAATAERLHSEATRAAEVALRLATVEQESATVQAELDRSRQHEAELGQLVADLQRTLSWRITAPLRKVRTLRSGR
ncbi:FkbM family methyltransferase [Subtercola boreus]|uniref:FkbM family methyltransferase n=1 Tax=Subtercola boreus TaxID=120213 RepID=UPI00116C6038|nr:FkbM family methyltransferase [Subtercola boreus]TQL54636.1 FkbM family methyltransferase [Subtercola boreus]